jgi:hypothetical protein
MENESGNHRLIQLLYLRDRTVRRLRRSTDLQEVWNLYQEMKVLNVHISLLESATASASATR